MKLKKFTKPEEYVKYWHNGEDIDVPEYVYREDDMRAAWVSNVANIDTPRGLSEEDAKAMIVRGFAEPISKELPIEYAVEMNNLINLELEGAIG